MQEALPNHLRTLAEHRIDGLHGALQSFSRRAQSVGLSSAEHPVACTLQYFDRWTHYFRIGSLRAGFYDDNRADLDEAAFTEILKWIGGCRDESQMPDLQSAVLPPQHPHYTAETLKLGDTDGFWAELCSKADGAGPSDRKRLLSRLIFQFRFPRRVAVEGVFFRTLEKAVGDRTQRDDVLDAVARGLGWGMLIAYSGGNTADAKVRVIKFGDRENSEEHQEQHRNRYSTSAERVIAARSGQRIEYAFEYSDRSGLTGFKGPCEALLEYVGVNADFKKSLNATDSRSPDTSETEGRALLIPLYDYTTYVERDRTGAVQGKREFERIGYGSIRGVATLLGPIADIQADSQAFGSLMAAADALRNRIEVLDLDRALANPIARGHDLLDHFLSSIAYVQDREWAVVLDAQGHAIRGFGRTHPKALQQGGGSEPRKWQKLDPKTEFCRMGAAGEPTGGVNSPSLGYSIPSSLCDLGQHEWIHAAKRRFQWPAGFWSSLMLPSLSSDDRARYGGFTIEYGLPLHAPAPEIADEERSNLEAYLLNVQLDLMRGLIPRFYQRRSALRNIVGSIMGRNMSHNIGSHVLARYSAEPDSAALLKRFVEQEGPSVPLVRSDADSSSARAAETSEQRERRQAEGVRRDAVRYLQTRMDFIAESSTAESAFEQPMSLFRDALSEFNDQTLLRYFISGKEGITSEISSFNGVPCGALQESGSDQLFSCPGGSVGVHALLIIMENIIRNCARHSPPKEGVVRLEFFARDCAVRSDLIEVTVFDNGTRNVPDKAMFASDGSATKQTGPLAEHVNQIIQDIPFLTADNSPNTSYWGVREMQICATYLRGVSLEDIESHRTGEDTPVLKAIVRKNEHDEEWVGYQFFLRKARICAVIVDDESIADFDDTQDQDGGLERRNAELRRYGYRLIRERDIQPNADQARPSAGPAADILGGYLYAVVTPRCSVQPDVRWPVRTLRCDGNDGLAMGISRLLDLGSHDEFLKSAADGSLETELAVSWTRQELTESRAIAMELTEPKALPNYNPLVGAVPSVSVGGLNFFPRVSYIWRHRSGLHDRLTLDSLSELKKKDSAALLVWFSHLNLLPSSDSLKALSGFEALFSDLPQQRIWNEFTDAGTKGVEQRVPREAASLFCMVAALAAGVVILDERVQSEYLKTYRGLRLGALWALSNVFVPEAEHCNLNYPNLPSIREFIDGLGHKHPYFSRPIKVRYLVIHQTILDSLYAANKDQVDLWLGDLQDIRLIVCSGRGTPRGHDKFPRCGRFAAYSIIARHLIHLPSKFGLIAGLDASRHPN